MRKKPCPGSETGIQLWQGWFHCDKALGIFQQIFSIIYDIDINLIELKLEHEETLVDLLYYTTTSVALFVCFQECKQWNGHYRSLSIRCSGTSTKQTRILGRIEIPIESSKCILAEETWRTSPWCIIWSYNGELLGFVNLYANIACFFLKRLLYLDVRHQFLNFYTSTSHLKPLCQF